MAEWLKAITVKSYTNDRPFIAGIVALESNF